MKIYAIDNTDLGIEEDPFNEVAEGQDYDEWRRYITEYKPNMVPTINNGGDEKVSRSREEYLAWKDYLKKYCEDNFDEGVVYKVLSLYRQIIPIAKISKMLNISTVYISTILSMNMSIGEIRKIKAEIRSRSASNYTGYKSRNRNNKSKNSGNSKLPLEVWKLYYVQKKNVVDVAKELGESVDKISEIIELIQKSKSQQVSKF